jgi:tetratricopeptide (TPR) repeat protein
VQTPFALTAIAGLLATAIALQVWRDRGWQPYEPATPLLWLQDAPTVRKASLGFDALIADLYWMRAVVYFGRQRLSSDAGKNYDLLYPYLDFVTTLDPRFKTAYRFGAIFLTERHPGGPDRPDLAVKLLQQGNARSPDEWEYLHDIGFVHFWSYQDYTEAARWFQRASEVPGAPIWLKSTAAAMLAQGGDRESARLLWRQMRDSASSDWIARSAELHLAQYDAMDAIDQLNQLLWRYEARRGQFPRDWQELIRAGVLRGVPLDPSGTAYELDRVNEAARVSSNSPLWPMPDTLPPPGQ